MSLINLLIGLLGVVLIVYLIFWVLGRIPMPEPARTVITGVTALILLLILLNWVGAVNWFGV